MKINQYLFFMKILLYEDFYGKKAGIKQDKVKYLIYCILILFIDSAFGTNWSLLICVNFELCIREQLIPLFRPFLIRLVIDKLSHRALEKPFKIYIKTLNLVIDPQADGLDSEIPYIFFLEDILQLTICQNVINVKFSS